MALKDYAAQLFLVSLIGWIVFLVVLDLGAFVMSGGSETAPREESRAADEAKSGCIEIDGIRICD